MAASRATSSRWASAQPILPPGLATSVAANRVAAVDGFDVYQVDAFVEKPDAQRAAEFLASDIYSWNSGMFVWQVRRIMAEFARQMPELLRPDADHRRRAGHARLRHECWRRCGRPCARRR